MDQAKVAVSEFLVQGGHHDTTIHEVVAPAVLHETVNPTRHEEVTTAVDKEIHQDHYHTSVQPIHDHEVLPEVHTHNLVAVEHLNLNHDNTDLNLQKLKEEASKYKDNTVITATRQTTSTVPTIAAEHVHHHVHEIIQPIIHKETIQPHVVHTTIPIHEVHHNLAQHHSTVSRPAMTMEEYKRIGGALTGREERFEQFTGEPKAIGGMTGIAATTKGHNKSDSGVDMATGVLASPEAISITNSPQEKPSADESGKQPLEPALAAAREATSNAAPGQNAKYSSLVPQDEDDSTRRSSGSIKAKTRSLRDRLTSKHDAEGDKKLGIWS